MGLFSIFSSRRLLTAPAAEPVPLPRGHIPALDGIRGLAILLVTIYRFSGIRDYETAAWLKPLLEFGTHGVDLFFVLSGFLITGILFDSKGDEHYFRNFYARRTLRIFPLYYFTLLVVLVLLPWCGLSTNWLQASPTDVSSLWYYGGNVLMAYHGEWHLGALNHFWSLCVEEHFYLVWPLVIFMCSRTTAMRVCAAAFLASAGSRILWMLLGGNRVAPEVFTLFRLDALCAGAWIALAARGPNGLTNLLPGAKLVALATGLMLLPIIALQKQILTVPTTLYAGFFAAFILLAVAAGQDGWLSFLGKSKVLQWLGRYSYGMYVYQNLLLVGFASFFTPAVIEHWTGSAVFGRVAFLVSMFALTCGVAWVSWNVLEKRCLAFKHYFEAKKA
jgi:peptidoglycan/LPS O-acetylase OafA/YrhL